ncbi:putative ATP-grasp-modified RiPP [Actinacidiphila epipremni]|jgi:putative ATP-grasp target RiPP|nr:putative ATP-grasp-modified RiPP [Actinacidiphila epipremni]
MRPFPVSAVVAAATVVLDAESQTGRWVGPDGSVAVGSARHKRSETSKETKPKTSLDGTTDEGSDQEGDTD